MNISVFQETFSCEKKVQKSAFIPPDEQDLTWHFDTAFASAAVYIVFL